jgi:hypothetical protein
MKNYEDEDRLLQEIDRKNKEIHDLSNNTTKDIDGAWTSAYDRETVAKSTLDYLDQSIKVRVQNIRVR